MKLRLIFCVAACSSILFPTYGSAQGISEQGFRVVFDGIRREFPEEIFAVVVDNSFSSVIQDGAGKGRVEVNTAIARSANVESGRREEIIPCSDNLPTSCGLRKGISAAVSFLAESVGEEKATVLVEVWKEFDTVIPVQSRVYRASLSKSSSRWVLDGLEMIRVS